MTSPGREEGLVGRLPLSFVPCRMWISHPCTLLVPMAISGGTKGCLGVLEPGQDLGLVVHDHPWEWVSVGFQQAIAYLFKSEGP